VVAHGVGLPDEDIVAAAVAGERGEWAEAVEVGGFAEDTGGVDVAAAVQGDAAGEGSTAAS
jgi:hypothetical protein